MIVVEINQSIGAPLSVMRKMVEAKNVTHPVLWDHQCRNTQAYGIEMWPFVYLIDADGKVFWEGNPARWISRDKRVEMMRKSIERKLLEVNQTERDSIDHSGSPESPVECRGVGNGTGSCRRQCCPR